MRICPNCEKRFKYKIISNIFCSPWYKLRCDKCNTRIELTKKTNNINSIVVTLPIMFYVIFSEKIMNFIINFTKNESVSVWGLIVMYVLWGIIIYNGHFPWTKYKIFEEKKQS
ncbi:hypothetical protein [Clostridium tertium]|uniref:hypothetical protein n=1 Tax=Clostridium tertium TaxID=1559 RepID=UPI00232AF2CA|nr:hypothetical protein [Clostridium tertium]MDB1940574.1 hypothetical protein [Clostridium tertium]